MQSTQSYRQIRLIIAPLILVSTLARCGDNSQEIVIKLNQESTKANDQSGNTGKLRLIAVDSGTGNIEVTLTNISKKLTHVLEPKKNHTLWFEFFRTDGTSFRPKLHVMRDCINYGSGIFSTLAPGSTLSLIVKREDIETDYEMSECGFIKLRYHPDEYSLENLSKAEKDSVLKDNVRSNALKW